MSELNAKIMLVHAKEAEEWRKTTRYERQRTLRPYHVKYLANLMRHHHFRKGSPIDFGILGGRWFNVNGQHTLGAIEECGIPQPCCIIEHVCEKAEDLPRLYSSFDRQLTRSPIDMIRAYGFTESFALTERIAGALYSAVKLILSGFVHVQPSRGESSYYLRDDLLLYDAMCNWAPEALLLSSVIRGAQEAVVRKILRQGVLAVALVTLRHDKTMAEEFWGDVTHDAKLGTPARALQTFLLDTPNLQMRTAAYARQVASPWNAYCQDRAMKQIRYPTVKSLTHPIVLRRTPHTGRHVLRYISDQGEILQKPVPYNDPLYAEQSSFVDDDDDT
jgi:hypothetical protein